jgi:DNA helicase HerA-like ATPase
MIEDGKILLGKAGKEREQPVYLLPGMLNRHGLVAGASGTGKTVTLKVICESLSEMGVPTFLADIKGDLTGMITPGDASIIQERLDSMGIRDFHVQKYPVHFFDVYREHGIPVRAVFEDMDPVLVSRMLDLTEAQEGVINVIFACARDMHLNLIDLKDMQAMTGYVSEHAKELSGKYGNVSRQSAGVIQRKLLELENQKGDLFFGMPQLNIEDFMKKDENGYGYMNILECAELFQHPALYSSFMMWILNQLYDALPEVGDADKPKIVFVFDEAHLLFDHASKDLLEEINQVIRLIRSKGVGIFFCSQSPTDIPDSVLSQISNRIQHALRAYTPAEMKKVRAAAEAFRANPDLDTEEVLTSLKTGHALVSVLDESGAPTMVQETKILPPKSSMEASEEITVDRCISADPLYDQYKEDIDPDSAYEAMDDIAEDEAEEKAEAEEAKKAEKRKEAEEKAEAREEARRAKQGSRIARKVVNRLENEAINMGIRSAKKFLKNLFR